MKHFVSLALRDWNTNLSKFVLTYQSPKLSRLYVQCARTSIVIRRMTRNFIKKKNVNVLYNLPD